MNYHKFDLLSLRLFLAACELGSFKSAAHAVHLVPSAASRRIAEMESELGTRLFERHAVGVNLTEAGMLLQRHASLILTNYDNLYLECADLSAGIKGVVRVWGSSTAFTAQFSEVIRSFLEIYQNVRIELEEQFDSEIVEAINENRADIGFFSSHQRAPGLQTLPFSSDEVVVVLPPSHPLSESAELTFEDLAAHDVIGWSDDTALGRIMVEYGSAIGAPLRIRLKVESLGAFCQLIKANLGVGLAPYPQVDAELKRHGLEIRPLAVEWAQRKILVGFRDEQALSATSQLLIRHIRQASAAAVKIAA
jgi:DNA-binding transcriptional LysR family regulator